MVMVMMSLSNNNKQHDVEKKSFQTWSRGNFNKSIKSCSLSGSAVLWLEILTREPTTECINSHDELWNFTFVFNVHSTLQCDFFSGRSSPKKLFVFHVKWIRRGQKERAKANNPQEWEQLEHKISLSSWLQTWNKETLKISINIHSATSF